MRVSCCIPRFWSQPSVFSPHAFHAKFQRFCVRYLLQLFWKHCYFFFCSLESLGHHLYREFFKRFVPRIQCLALRFTCCPGGSDGKRCCCFRSRLDWTKKTKICKSQDEWLWWPESSFPGVERRWRQQMLLSFIRSYPGHGMNEGEVESVSYRGKLRHPC